MRSPRRDEWFYYACLVVCFVLGLYTGDYIVKPSAKPLNEHASCELLIHRNHRNQSLAILNLGYAINEDTEVSIGELESILGCQACHGRAE